MNRLLRIIKVVEEVKDKYIAARIQHWTGYIYYAFYLFYIVMKTSTIYVNDTAIYDNSNNNVYIKV